MEGVQLWGWEMAWRREKLAVGCLKYMFYIYICKLWWGLWHLFNTSCTLLLLVIVYNFFTVGKYHSLGFFLNTIHLRHIIVSMRGDFHTFYATGPSRWHQHSLVPRVPEEPALHWTLSSFQQEPEVPSTTHPLARSSAGAGTRSHSRLWTSWATHMPWAFESFGQV